MPTGGTYLNGPDLDEINANADALTLGQGDRYAAEFNAQIGHTTAQLGELLYKGQSAVAHDVFGVQNPAGAPVDSDELNERYGVPGYLRFNQPTTEDDAAWQSAEAERKRFLGTVLSKTNPSPLMDFGASLAGGLLDPASLGIMYATGGLGEAALARAGWGLTDGVTLAGKVANAARVPAEGLVSNAPFVGINAGISNASGDDYGMGDALRDLALGAIVHTGAHLTMRALGAHAVAGVGADDPDASPTPAERGGNAFEPNPVPAGGVPDEVNALPETARAGAFVKALDDMADDRPVDLGGYVEKELEPPTLSALDETGAESRIPSFRPLDGQGETAVTTRGTEVPIQYGLAELGDLTTSHGDNLEVNPAYPPELQPRERDRAGAMARNYQLESELNPKLLMGDVSAAAGAPIVGPDGVVESGNGRTIALRRSAAKNGAAYQAYKAELAARGYDTTGMQQPALVRMRTEPMTGSQRAGLAREMNADVTERMSVTEQAAADAKSIDGALLEHLDGTPQGRRSFARGFLQRVAPDQINSLVAPDGALSKAGEDRIDAALTAKAYGDPRLVEAIFESADPNIKAIGGALRTAAPAWAAMRGAMALGKIPEALDVTGALRSAVDLVRHARDTGMRVGDLVRERLPQAEMFGGASITPETEAFLRLFFRDEGFNSPLAREKLAGALMDFARAAGEFTPGPNLFGDVPDVATARQILEIARKRAIAGDDGEPELLRPPGRPDGGGATEPAAGAGDEARLAVLDVRQPGELGSGGGEGVSPEGGREPGGEGAGSEPAGGEPAKPNALARALAENPELRELAEATDNLAAAHGVEVETPPAQDPATVAEAIHAAAVCLTEELPL